jgi:myo-inositol-1(or 4)-monophosphatase
MENKSEELIVAIKAAQEAGKILEKYFETEILKDLKEDKSIVTLADRESEEVIKKIIFDVFPDHAILGEETGLNGGKGKQGDYVWHVDPVDGTRNFANGIPLFAVSIALVYREEVVVGVVYNPATRSMFYAEKGKGAYLNDKKISVSRDDADHGIVTISPGNRGESKELLHELYYKMPHIVRSVRNLGCTAIELSYLARGGTEGYIQLGLNTYDFAAGTLIAQEAGAKFTMLDGGEWKFPENHFVASNGVFHDLLVEEVKKQKEKLGLVV